MAASAQHPPCLRRCSAATEQPSAHSGVQGDTDPVLLLPGCGVAVRQGLGYRPEPEADYKRRLLSSLGGGACSMLVS